MTKFTFILRSRLLYLLTAILAVVFVLPVFWLVISSLKIETELVRWPIAWFPQVPQWDNYVQVLTNPRFGFFDAILKSLELTLLNAIPNVFVCAMGGYALARINAPGRNLTLTIMLSTMMIPGTITIIPSYVINSKLGLVNNPLLWLLWGLGGSAFSIILFRQFFSSFPKELEDAAAIDGANPLTTFFLIFLPNARAVLSVTFLFSFAWNWGDFFGQSLYLTAKNATLAMKLATAFKTPMGRPIYSLSFAGIILYALPLILLYLLLQRQIVQGIVTTGLKG
jgi:multiple sugar transport system permease protein